MVVLKNLYVSEFFGVSVHWLVTLGLAANFRCGYSSSRSRTTMYEAWPASAMTRNLLRVGSASKEGGVCFAFLLWTVVHLEGLSKRRFFSNWEWLGKDKGEVWKREVGVAILRDDCGRKMR